MLRPEESELKNCRYLIDKLLEHMPAATSADGTDGGTDAVTVTATTGSASIATAATAPLLPPVTAAAAPLLPPVVTTAAAGAAGGVRRRHGRKRGRGRNRGLGRGGRGGNADVAANLMPINNNDNYLGRMNCTLSTSDSL